jgi:putative zinc finger/helix-turn-helix YgiT family protein
LIDREEDTMNKDYCLVCNKRVNAIIIDKRKKYIDDEIAMEYEGKVAKCPVCGEELFNEYVNEYNQKKIKEKYKEENEIITIEEIEEILEKYNIGKRPLSLLLGFGEITITRYLEGYLPTPKNSKMLMKILNSPSDYYSILQMNKDNITKIAFEKSEESTKKLLGINSKDEVILEISKYIINKIEVTNMSLQKILYYVQMFYMTFFDKHAFNSKCSAWDYGPVFGLIYYKYKSFCRSILTEDDEINDIENKDLKKVVDYVIKYFGCYNGHILREFTHNEKPWLDSYQTVDKIIEKSEIKNFGKNIIKKYDIKNLDEIYKYSDSMINKL